MNFSEVESRTVFTNFSPTEESSIRGAMRSIYEGSNIARNMLDHWVGARRLQIFITRTDNVFGANRGEGAIFLDLNRLDNLSYIENNGTAVKTSLVMALTHEFVHALNGLTDRDADYITDYRGSTVKFSNTIYRELGIPEQNSYIAL